MEKVTNLIFREPINEKFIYPNLNIKQAIESFLNESIFFNQFIYNLFFYLEIHGRLSSKERKITHRLNFKLFETSLK